MRAPAFWNNPPDAAGLAAHLLAPLGALTRLATARRVARAPMVRADIPVICVGNLTAGGAGKTPTVLALVQMLQAQGLRPAVLSRGYGGALEGPVQVDPTRHTAADVGDEPLLMQAFAPVWIAKDRAAGVRAVSDADVLILDDGFQNPAVAKDLSLVVVDAEVGFGNGRCLPAGPLREPVAAGLARADAVVAIGPDTAQARFAATWPGLSKPVFSARLEPLETGMPWQGARVLAFAGIGRPDKFFATLRGLGADLVGAVPLSDHQPLTSRLLARLRADAQKQGAQLVTTEKDAIRLSMEDRMQILTVPVRLQFDDVAGIEKLLAGLKT